MAQVSLWIQRRLSGMVRTVPLPSSRRYEYRASVYAEPQETGFTAEDTRQGEHAIVSTVFLQKRLRGRGDLLRWQPVGFTANGKYLVLRCAGLSDAPVLLHWLVFWLGLPGPKTKGRWVAWRSKCEEKGLDVCHRLDERRGDGKLGMWWRNVSGEIYVDKRKTNRGGAR